VGREIFQHKSKTRTRYKFKKKESGEKKKKDETEFFGGQAKEGQKGIKSPRLWILEVVGAGRLEKRKEVKGKKDAGKKKESKCPMISLWGALRSHYNRKAADEEPGNEKRDNLDG